MARDILTDSELRARWRGEREITLSPGTIVTPAARDFLHEKGVAVRTAGETMTVRAGTGGYIDEATGQPLAEKGEFMTHLHANVLVPKTDPRIAFRGKLDSLMAQTLLLQCRALSQGLEELAAGLGEVLETERAVLAAEVKGEPLPERELLGLDGVGLRRVSHHVLEEIGIPHPIPGPDMGETALELNCLRTQVREVELAAAAAFGEGREDILRCLNRLSSAVYILFCRLVAARRGIKKKQ